MKTKHALLALAVASLASASLAQSPLTLAKTMAAKYQADTMSKNFAGFEKESTPDFVYTDAKGHTATKAQAISGMKAFYGGLTIKSLKVTAVSAKTTPGGLVYIQDTKIEGVTTMGGPKAMVFKSASRDEVTMVKQGGKWLTKRVKNLKSVDTIDGKPMKM